MEALHPDLVPYVQSNGGLPGLFHPLIYSLFYTEHENERINKLYEYKCNRLKESLEAEDFHTFVFAHERPYRLDAFRRVHRKLTDQTYWELLSDIYTDSENIWQNKDYWLKFLSSDRQEHEHFMSESEREEFLKLPKVLTLYRGYIPRKNNLGFSYTLNKEKAEWFANRFSKNGRVKKISLLKISALGLKTCRSEDEIVLRSPR